MKYEGKGEDGKQRKCIFCGRTHKLKIYPANDKEHKKCKKRNHWTDCCQSQEIQRIKKYVLETITENQMLL